MSLMHFLQERKERDLSEEKIVALRRELQTKLDGEEAALRRENSERASKVRKDLSEEMAQVERQREEITHDRKALEQEEEALSKKVIFVPKSRSNLNLKTEYIFQLGRINTVTW